MQIIIDNLMTSYSVAGKGPVVLFLHGWGDNKETFSTLSNELSGSYHVVSVDLPGFGATEAPSTAWGLDDYCIWVANFIKKLKVDSVYAVIGHSNGGAIAIKSLSGQYIDSKKLILLASSGIRTKDSVKKIINNMIAKIGKAITIFLPKNQKQILRRKMYRSMGSDITVAPHMEETFKNVVAEDIVAQTKNINIPTLIIYGDDDTYTPPEFGRELSENIKDSKLIIVPNAGHFIQKDAPEVVNSAIRKFL